MYTWYTDILMTKKFIGIMINRFFKGRQCGYIYTTELYLASKKRKLLNFGGKINRTKTNTLSWVTQTQTNVTCLFVFSDIRILEGRKRDTGEVKRG